MSKVKLTKVVEVDAARIEALTPEAFRLVLEARGWFVSNLFADGEFGWCGPGGATFGVSDPCTVVMAALAGAHHSGSTFDAFVEVERVQALLSAVEAAERGEWVSHRHRGGPQRFKAEAATGAAEARVYTHGYMHVIDSQSGTEYRLSPWPRSQGANPDRAAREARAQLPRLVRIVCGVEQTQ